MLGVFRKKIELKLGVIFLFIVFIPVTIISLVSYFLIVGGIQREIKQRITSNLNVSAAIFDKIKNQLRYTIRDQNGRIRYYFETDNLSKLPAYLKAMAEQNDLNILLVTNKKGKVIARSNLAAIIGDDLSSDPAIGKALQGQDIVSTEIITAEEIKKEGIKTNYSQGMLIKIIMPVKEPDDTVLGVTIGGYLLNENREIVDIISNLVGAQAAIIQTDTIISSSLNEDGKSLTGVKINPEIADLVLHKGGEFVGPDPTTTTYMLGLVPIRNWENEIIGSIYIRATEESFIGVKRKMQATIFLMAGFSIFLALLIGYLVGHPITGSITNLRRGAEIVSRGNFDHRIEVETEDEIKELADSFNSMTLDLKEAQKKLLQSEKMAALGQIAAAVSHELKNPLTSIKMGAFLLKGKLSSADAETGKALADIEAEVDRANKIVTEILTFSQPISPVFSPVNVNEVLAEIMPLMEYQAQFQQIKVEKKFSANLAAISADRDQIKQVFENLIINALQAMDAGGVLVLRTIQEDDWIKISIKDNGVGIAQENIKSIFQPFFTTKDKGIGLGLSIVNEIVKKHLGAISVRSKLGEGTTFTVSFPKHA